ncbi:hypothetical protein V6N13_113974 [Hibiscus sabdariffa]
MDRGRQDSLLEERGVTVWREETTLAVSREALAPAAATDGERGIKQCDENLTVVPIEVTDSIPGHPVVLQVTLCLSEVVVLGGVTRKVRSVNDLIINTVSGN